MGMFDKKKKDIEKEEREELLKKIISEAEAKVSAPEKIKETKKLVSREFRHFKEEREKEKVYNLYEKICRFFEKVNINPDKETKKKLEEAIKFTGLKATPTGVFSFAVISALMLVTVPIFVLFLPLPFIFKLVSFMAPLGAGYLIFSYPLNKATVLRIESGRDLVISVLYMIVYMKNTPNLEGAVRFAANNVGGKLSADLNEVLWKVEMGIHNTVEDSLSEYILQWKSYNREFIESIQLIRESMAEMVPARRDILLDKAVDVILRGTNEKMKKYARELETPIMIIHGLGVLLPVMGMIVFPLLSIFMSEAIANLPIYLAIGYDILLPLMVYFLMKQTLDRRPSTHTSIDLSNHPEFIPMGDIDLKIGGSRHLIPVWPIALAIGLMVASPGLIFFVNSNFFYATAGTGTGMFMSILMVLGLAVGLIIYYFGTSFQKTNIRDKTIDVESEFEEALFALGNRLSGGTPIEVALTEAEEDTRELGISELFRICLKNINRLNMTFKQALFDKKYGALKYYPSKLIRTIMRSISETVEKGTKAAAMTTLTISRYLRDIHSTQERIDDMLSSTLSSMRFQAYLLVPAISGVVVAIADLIMKILAQLSATFSQIAPAGGEAGGMGMVDPTEMLFSIKTATPPELLQLIVGIYVVEILVLLGIFISRIEVGRDQVKQNDTAWKLILVGTVMYIIIFGVVTALFGPLITAASVVG